jgi:hypothetical protein
MEPARVTHRFVARERKRDRDARGSSRGSETQRRRSGFDDRALWKYPALSLAHGPPRVQN